MDLSLYVELRRRLSLSCQHFQCPGTFALNSFLPVGRKTKGNIYIHVIIVIPVLTVHGIFCTILVVSECLFNV